MTSHEIKIHFQQYASVEELNEPDKALCLESVKALQNSHSPYSKFKVGAAMRLQSGRIIYASNQENVAYPSGLCAERVALFYWGANHPGDPIESMAVTAHSDEFKIIKPVTSCGACLQVLAEYERKQGRAIKMLLYCQGGPVWAATGIESFLPFLFFEDRLTQPNQTPAIRHLNLVGEGGNKNL
ncbi:MAG: cytidine deaminase [Mucilaginibacter sp.]|nr:cytidine deaminase [Mucilaginibacter sp.]